MLSRAMLPVLTGWVRADGALVNHSILPEIVSAEPLAIAIPKGQQYRPLQTAVNQAIQRLYAEEWLQSRAQFWGLPEGVLPSMLSEADNGEPADEEP